MNDLLIKACAVALVRVPACNAQFSPDAILYHRRVDISVAVAVADGLVTPVVRNADQKTVVAIATEVRELAARARAKKLTLERVSFDPRGLIEDVSAIVVTPAHAKGVRVVTNLVAVRHRALGDPNRIRQVMINLISNAVKFTSEGDVVVSARTELDQGGRLALHLSVRDAGIGIPAAVLPQLFTAFTQADLSTTRKFGGTGLGLAISRHLITLMGGTVDVQSEVGVGSLFQVSLNLPSAGDHEPAVAGDVDRPDNARCGMLPERLAGCIEGAQVPFRAEHEAVAGGVDRQAARCLVRLQW